MLLSVCSETNKVERLHCVSVKSAGVWRPEVWTIEFARNFKKEIVEKREPSFYKNLIGADRVWFVQCRDTTTSSCAVGKLQVQCPFKYLLGNTFKSDGNEEKGNWICAKSAFLKVRERLPAWCIRWKDCRDRSWLGGDELSLSGMD